VEEPEMFEVPVAPEEDALVNPIVFEPSIQTKRMETDMLCGAMTKMKQVQKSADDLAIPTK